MKDRILRRDNNYQKQSSQTKQNAEESIHIKREHSEKRERLSGRGNMVHTK